MRPFLHSKLVKRMALLGHNYAAALHAEVPAAVLPPAFGGTCDEPFHRLLDAMEAREGSEEGIGGFAFPLSVDDPTGATRRAAKAAAAAADAAAAAGARLTAFAAAAAAGQ